MTSASVPAPLPRQPDGTTCGPTCVAVARAMQDPSYAAVLRRDATTVITAEHRRLASGRGADGGRWMPWPRALGTSPWAAAATMAEIAHRPFVVRLLPRDPAAAFAAVADARSPSLVYVGSRFLPRHVVLLTAASEQVTVVEPAAGAVLTLSASRVAEDPRIAGWPRWWLLVTPRHRA